MGYGQSVSGEKPKKMEITMEMGEVSSPGVSGAANLLGAGGHRVRSGGISTFQLGPEPD
ncbi:hypothetical protein GCM10010038_33820 [Glutamicibacter protophormiae]|nr:hypothetical protein GCM10010038_33820 [Glutamicibacter protophormiae]